MDDNAPQRSFISHFNLRQIVKWSGFLLIALFLTIPLRLFVARPFVVSGDSMKPDFDQNEYLVIDEISYHFDKPKRGDVIIMRYPLDPSKFYIKRIVGLPGETLALRSGEVMILGKDGAINTTLQEPYIAAPSVKESDVTQLGNDEYYVLGDNRLVSSDSRAWGPLQEKYIVGRVLARLYPFNEVALFPGRAPQQ